jgi:spermidine/putrescine transport system substrate-binding protein
MSNRPRLAPPAGALADPLTRRTFLRGLSLSALAVTGGGVLSACGVDSATQTEESCPPGEDLSAKEKVLNFSNWPLYIDPFKSPVSTLNGFSDKTGIEVNYRTDVNSNDEFFGKVRNQLSECTSTGRDIFVVTDWMAGKMIDLGWIQELDKSNLPNVQANLIDNLRAPGFDPDRKYSVPWQSGVTGIAYNSDLTDEVSSFEDLLTRPDLKGKVTLLNEMRDTMLFLLLMEGADPEDFTDAEFTKAIDRLQKVVDSGQVRRFTGNDYTGDLENGNVLACEAWSGDVIQLQFGDPKFNFVAPEEGLALWSDNMLVPNKATHKTNAEKLMNYYYDPEIAAKLAAWVNYICPVEGAREAMKDIDASLMDNQLIFPDETFLGNAKQFMTLDEKQDKKYQTMFQQVIGA